MPRLRFQTHRLFGNQAALGADRRRKFGVFRRVDHIHPARHHRHRAALQRRLMRLGVDAARQSRHHHLPGARQALGQPPRHPQPQRRRVARADQRHRGPVEQRSVPQRPQHRRRIGQIQQRRRIAFRAPAQQHRPRRARLRGLVPHHFHRAGAVILHPRRTGNARQRRQRRTRRSVFADQLVKGHRPDPPRPDQPQPVERVVLHPRC